MTTMQDLRAKSIALTSYLELLINQRFSEDVQVITPSDVKARGSQLSIVIKKLKMEDIFSALCKRGVLVKMLNKHGQAILFNTHLDSFSLI